MMAYVIKTPPKQKEGIQCRVDHGQETVYLAVGLAGLLHCHLKAKNMNFRHCTIVSIDFFRGGGDFGK